MAEIIKTFEYQSVLPEFLSWNEWCLINLTPEELSIYIDGASATDPISEEKHQLFLRWIEDQQIISQICYENGVEVSRFSYNQV